MTFIDAQTICDAFNQNNTKKAWKARRLNMPGGERVMFESQNGMVALTLDPATWRYSVKFYKFHGAWGDYIKAIARGIYTVQTTLKSAGQPVEAPLGLNGTVIQSTTNEAGIVEAWWPGQMQGVQTFIDTYEYDQTDMAPLPNIL